jgi:hypothetical protein
VAQVGLEGPIGRVRLGQVGSDGDDSRAAGAERGLRLRQLFRIPGHQAQVIPEIGQRPGEADTAAGPGDEGGA